MQWIKSLITKSPRSSRDEKTARPQIDPTDLFLVSYPKSGNTWMRFLLANLLKSTGLDDDGQPIDFHTAINYIPEYELHTNEVNRAPRPRILKSHAPYDNTFPKAAYLVRDPRDVYVSYFHYMKKRLPQETDFSTFLRKQDLHPCHWHEHVAGWIDQDNVMVIRYEDMLKDTPGELRRLIDFWGQKSFTNKQIDRAVAASSFNSMRSLEQKNGRPFLNEQHARQSTPFMRSGKAGGWEEYFNRRDHDLLIQQAGDLMKRLKYETLDSQHKPATPKKAA